MSEKYMEMIINVICVLLVCLSVLLISCFAIYRVTQNTKLMIESGYSQAQNLGESGHHWMK